MKTGLTPIALFLLFAVASVVGCATPKGNTAVEKRASVQAMRADALQAFYLAHPHMQGRLERAPGYGVFSAFSTHTLVLSSGNAYGVIRDNRTGRDTYMRAVKLGGGWGAGAQQLYGVVVFHDSATMQDMLTSGWGMTGKAEAAGKIGDEGDAASMVVTLPGMSIYRITRNGAMIGGTIEGAKVWPDAELN